MNKQITNTDDETSITKGCINTHNGSTEPDIEEEDLIGASRRKRKTRIVSNDNTTEEGSGNTTAVDTSSTTKSSSPKKASEDYSMYSNNFQETMKVYDKYHRSGILKNPNAKNTTYGVYKSNFRLFLVWFDENYPDKYLLDKDDRELYLEFPSIVEDFMAHLMELGNNSKTINNKLVALSSFFIWCVKRGYLNTHPFQNRLDRMKTGDYDKRRESYFLTDGQLAVIDEHMKNSKDFSLRDRVMWKVMLDTAARRNAILNIKVEQIDFRNGLITNVKEKGNKMVELIVMADTLKLLEKYIKENNLQPKDFLFFRKSNKSEHICPATLVYTVRKVGAIVGIPDMYPHSIRKTRINQIYNEFGIDTASAYANHRDSKTTKDHYIKAKTSSDLRKIVIED